MAEKRFISQRVTESDKIRQLANEGKTLACFLYTALLPRLDSAGRMNANAAGLKATVFEGYIWTTEEIEGAIRDMARVGLVKLYSNGKFSAVIQYEKFHLDDGGFNKPHHREPPTGLPGPRDKGSTKIEVEGEPSPNIGGNVGLNVHPNIDPNISLNVAGQGSPNIGGQEQSSRDKLEPLTEVLTTTHSETHETGGRPEGRRALPPATAAYLDKVRGRERSPQQIELDRITAGAKP